LDLGPLSRWRRSGVGSHRRGAARRACRREFRSSAPSTRASTARRSRTRAAGPAT